MWFASEVRHKSVSSTGSEVQVASLHTSLRGYMSSSQINRPPKQPVHSTWLSKLFAAGHNLLHFLVLRKTACHFLPKIWSQKKKKKSIKLKFPPFICLENCWICLSSPDCCHIMWGWDNNLTELSVFLWCEERWCTEMNVQHMYQNSFEAQNCDSALMDATHL